MPHRWYDYSLCSSEKEKDIRLIGRLEVTESVSKSSSGFGGIAEGTCAMLRSSEDVGIFWTFLCLLLSFSQQCVALAEHAALITCATYLQWSHDSADSESIGDLLLYVLYFIDRFVSDTYAFSKSSSKREDLNLPSTTFDPLRS